MIDPAIPLAIHIRGTIDDFEDAREAAWRAEEGGERVLLLANQVAAAIHRVSKDLVLAQGYESLSAWEMVRDVASSELLSKEVRESLQIALASDLLPDSEEMAQRCLSITHEVVLLRPNESVLRFVRRLTRCYIMGLLPESVMLCRAVLENAVTEVVAALQLEPEPNHEGYIGMGSRLDALLTVNRLTSQTRADAALVWKRGNKAVHSDPLVVTEVEATIDMTVGILNALYRHPLPTSGDINPPDV